MISIITISSLVSFVCSLVGLVGIQVMIWIITFTGQICVCSFFFDLNFSVRRG